MQGFNLFLNMQFWASIGPQVKLERNFTHAYQSASRKKTPRPTKSSTESPKVPQKKKILKKEKRGSGGTKPEVVDEYGFLTWKRAHAWC